MKKILGCSFLGLLLITAGCSNNSDQKKNRKPGEKDATSVETITVKRHDISKQIKSFGTIKAEDVVEVTPQVNNRITKIYADLGDTVKQGQRLAKIYDASYRDQYQEAKAQLQQSLSSFRRDSSQFQRQKRLYKQDLISSSTFEEAQATYENSKAQVQSSRSSLTQSKEDLNNSVIRSPVFGVVLTRNVAQGDLASSGQTAFEIANLTGYETRVYLPLEEWQAAEVGQKATFSLSNGQQTDAQGRISRISPRLDPNTGLGEVVISLTNKGRNVYQGVLVQAIINVQTKKQAIVVPRSTLVENVQTRIEPESNSIELNRTYAAFVVQGDSLALKRDLKIGIEQGDKVEIEDGLQAGDKIVVTGQNGLEDSSKVQVAKTNPFQQDNSIPLGEGASTSSQKPKPDSTQAGGKSKDRTAHSTRN